VIFSLALTSVLATDISSETGGAGGVIFVVFLLVAGYVLWRLLLRSRRTKDQLKRTKRPAVQSNLAQPHPNPSPVREKPQTMTSSSDDRFVEITPGRPAAYVTAQLNSYENSAVRFVKDAQKFHKQGDQPEAVQTPMHQYYPTFQTMTAQQLAWYFKWRHQVRNNNYLPTDLSYIFVYVYELLCLVEAEDFTLAPQMIKALWLQYRSMYPEVDRYLPDWGGDLIAIHQGVGALIEWWNDLAQTAQVQYPADVLNVIVQRYIDAGKADQVPYYVLATINWYKPQNKFVERYNQDGEVTRTYEKAIAAINVHYKGMRSGKTLIERYGGSQLYPQKHRLFSAAIVPQHYKREMILGEAKNYATSGRLGTILEGITKHAENMLRKQKKFSARLSGYTIDAKHQAVIEKALAPAPDPVKITISKKRVATLRKESELVTSMLETENGNGVMGKSLYSEIAEVRQVWGALPLSAKRLIAIVYRKKVATTDQVSQEILGEGVTVTAAVAHINEASLPILGDRLISIEKKNRIQLAEDFLDELELVIQESAQKGELGMTDGPVEGSASTGGATNQVQPMGENTDSEPAEKELPDGYLDFIQSLTSGETQMLTSLVSAGSMTEEKVNQAGRSMSQMGSVLMDSIGEKAIDQLGRNPLYLDNATWIVEEEDLAILKTYLCSKGS
jgi:hypothetical protein